MSNYKYMAMAGANRARKPAFTPDDACVPIVWMDAGTNETVMFNEAFWLMKDCSSEEFVSFQCDAIYAFISGDIDDPENLGANVDIQIENDVITIDQTSIVFVPKGTSNGRIRLHDAKRPVFCYRCLLNASRYEPLPGVARDPVGTHTKATNVVERYERVDGTVPFQPFEGFLKLLLWIDGAKLPGAPYMESVWFCKPKPEKDAMDIPHTHEFDEFLGILGSDPEHPEELNGECHIWVDGEELVTTKSFLLCIPKGMHHCPMLVTRMDRPMIHFTGGNGGDYNRG